MKKHLIAAAVAAAVAMPAAAQVTIGGVVDLGYDMGDRNDTDSFSSTLSTSNLTISGSEDLGGGLKVFFNINSRLGQVFNPDGAVGADQAAQDSVVERAGAINFGDRGAQVGISSAIGEIAFGKTTGTAMGGVVRGGLVGDLSNLTSSSWGDRPNNMISYTSPAFNGLTVRYIYQTSTSSSEISVNYRSGPLNVTYASNDVNAVVANANQGTAAVIEGSDKGLRASYDFGFALVNVSYVKMETLTANVSRTMNSVGLQLPVPGIKNAVFAFDHGNRETAANADNKATNASVVYSLSKRTNAYLAYQSIDSLENHLTAVGIRHSF